MANQITPAPFPQGFALQDGDLMNKALARGDRSSQYNITAAGTNQATGVLLTAAVNHVGTAAASTGVVLPKAVAGRWVVVFNYGANTLAIYGNSAGDTIDGASYTTGTTLSAANRAAIFWCVSPGVWVSTLLGAVSS